MSASLLLCGCHYTVRSRICSLVVGTETLRSVSEMHCEVGRIGVFLLGEDPLSIPPVKLFICECALLCHISLIV